LIIAGVGDGMPRLDTVRVGGGSADRPPTPADVP